MGRFHQERATVGSRKREAGGGVWWPIVTSLRISGATSFMAKNKGVRIVITLECTECRSNPAKRSPGVSRYTTEKNRRNTTERLELKKFCPHCNTSTVHKEIK
jgi:large subunit ribosomal protein L33